MSLKSLLQLILLLMIIVIIGGIYYIYFLSKPSSNLIKNEDGLYQIDNKLSNQDLSMDDEVLDEVKFSNNKTNNNRDKTIKSEITSSEKKIKEKSNQSKEIEYIATRENGDIFKILAKYGRTNLKNSKMLDLEDVSGTISSKDKSDIYISSDFANYNYTNQDSKFYSNVKIKYDDKEITCDNFELSVSENLAVAYENVIFKNSGSIMKAKNIIVNISTKDIKINSNDKIEVFKK